MGAAFPRRIGLVVAAALAAAAIVVNQAPARAATVIAEFPLLTATGTPESITLGPDGNLWFTEFANGGGHQIGQITPAGAVTEFGGLVGFGPFWIAKGPDGNLWFTESTGNMIGRINPASTPPGAVTEFVVPTPGSTPDQIAAGPDGNLWFTEFSGNRIALITPAGVVTEFAALAAGAGPTAIIAGPDGALWFTEQSGNKIGRITTAGIVTEYALPTANSTPAGIAVGPDGALWFAEFTGNQIGRITTAGVVAEFAVTTAASQPGSIAAGPDGNLWFTEFAGNNIGRMTPAGAMLGEFSVPTAGSQPGGIAAGPDGNIWFTEVSGNQIGRLTPGTVAAATALTYTGPATGDFNDPATVSATLASNSLPLSGQSVTFTLNGLDTCTGVTDATGKASCQLTPSEPSGSYTLAVSFAGSAVLLASSASTSFAVTAEETTITLATPSLARDSRSVTLAATLTEDGTRPIAGRTVTLGVSVGSATLQCTATTNAAGTATCAIPLTPSSQQDGEHHGRDGDGDPISVTASFAGDGFYVPASAKLTFPPLAHPE